MIATQVLQALLNAPSIEELWALHTRKMTEYGFDRLIYGATRYRTATSLGDPEDFVILTNHSTDYADEFINQSMYFHAPMVKWALANEGSCSWAVIQEKNALNCFDDSELEVVKFNEKHDVTVGYSISFNSISPRTKGAVALTARPDLNQEQIDDVWAEHGDDIEVLNTVAHLRILSLPYTAPGRELTVRQREVLGWVGDGKTAQDIAVILGLTSATVEKHLRLAREALCVETTAQAVLKASFQNQIFRMDI